MIICSPFQKTWFLWLHTRNRWSRLAETPRWYPTSCSPSPPWSHYDPEPQCWNKGNGKGIRLRFGHMFYGSPQLYWSNLGSVHHGPITFPLGLQLAGWARQFEIGDFTWYLCTWPAVETEPKTFWSWVQCHIHSATVTHWTEEPWTLHDYR